MTTENDELLRQLDASLHRTKDMPYRGRFKQVRLADGFLITSRGMMWFRSQRHFDVKLAQWNARLPKRFEYTAIDFKDLTKPEGATQ